MNTFTIHADQADETHYWRCSCHGIVGVGYETEGDASANASEEHEFALAWNRRR